MMRGSVDVVTSTEVRGWAYAPEQNWSVQVQVLLNQEILGESNADLHRADLAAAGLGNGNSGFAIKMFREIDALYLPFLVVKVNGGDAELPRAPLLGYKDYFSSLYINFPAAGRQRSVFGGLWTDRTDASALLRGKVEIGQVPAGAATAIQQLIQTGVAMVSLPQVPLRAARTQDLGREIGELLEEDSLLALLRAVLEDQPLVVRIETPEDLSELAQPSAKATFPSPAECLELVISFGEGVVLETVRHSHLLPEFTPHGHSRWIGNGVGDVTELVLAAGLLDRQVMAAGTVAVIGPGTIYRLRSENGAAVRIVCLPARARPLSVALDVSRTEHMRPTGVLVWA